MALSGIGAAGAFGAYALAPALATNSASALRLTSLALASAATVPSTPVPAMTVAIGNPVTASGVYGKPVSVDPETLAWATPPTDGISPISRPA
jgi:hypothetical protein